MSMNRIKMLFEYKTKNILSVYLTAGYPDIESTVEVIERLAENGVDMIEIGIPYSDPLADGPVIQRTSQQALENGMTISVLFEQLRVIRQRVSVPLVIMSYFNPILIYGFKRFCCKCKEVGIDGLIIPDLPFDEYLTNYKDIIKGENLEFISLITPQTSEDRIRKIDTETDAFIYMVSSASTTGNRDSFTSENEKYFKRIKELKLNNPCLIGFGVSNKVTYDQASHYSNGVIVGSRFMDSLKKGMDIDQAIKNLLSVLRG